MMLRDGQGGFSDFPKYRTQLTDIVFHGKEVAVDPAARAAAAKQAAGTPIPADAMAEARAIHDAAKRRAAERNQLASTPHG